MIETRCFPLNSLNEVTDESPKFLQEDELVEAQIDENIEEVIEAEPSKKEPALSTQTSDESVTMNKTVASIEKYFHVGPRNPCTIDTFFCSNNSIV